MEGVVDDLPTIEQCAVVREIDLFQEWFPLCSKSVMVDSIGHADYFA
jgi:aminoglycoside/choline kinase family phosphotransferase